VEDLIAFAKERGNGKGEMGNGISASVRTELAERSIEAETARLLSYRVISMQHRGMVPNHEASAIKLYAAELSLRVASTGVKVAGLYGQLDRDSKAPAEAATNRYAPNKGRLMRTYLNAVSATIAGGTGEVNRNIIAGRGLGLPRD